MAASIDVLRELHAELAQDMLNELRWYRENEIPIPAADKAAIAKFLKDNSITCDPADTSDLQALRDQLAEGRKRQMRSTAAIEAAEDDLREQYGVH